jgi:hypothetical protein
MWIGNDVTGSCRNTFKEIYGLDQMIEDDVMTKFEVLCGLEHM